MSGEGLRARPAHLGTAPRHDTSGFPACIFSHHPNTGRIDIALKALEDARQVCR